MDLGPNPIFFILAKSVIFRKKSLQGRKESPELHADWTAPDQCLWLGECHVLIGSDLSYRNQSRWKTGSVLIGLGRWEPS